MARQVQKPPLQSVAKGDTSPGMLKMATKQQYFLTCCHMGPLQRRGMHANAGRGARNASPSSA
ncbi:hypothetical protein PR048_005077 [Dryococelus australis]|uniref:Uncharacterized protein n=1 Tax=Dryococelus australis TaxID=614101 RepID=A0ABQ9I778_9NEOP|nr:hypothetical protein PR048_005077 [Dryococelus australis]